MEFYLSSFGLHNPYISSPLPEHAVFPISTELENGIDLEYTSLLLGEMYFVDQTAFDYITSGEKDFLKPMAKTMSFLKDEGFIEIFDAKKIIEENYIQLQKKVDHLVENYTPWLSILRNQWKNVKKSFYDFHTKYGHHENFKLNTYYFPILNFLNIQGEMDNKLRYEELLKLIETSKNKLSASEEECIKEILKPLLAQLLINDLIRSKKNSPVLNWDDSKAYYEQLYSHQWNSNNEDNNLLLKNARTLFNVIVPELKPKNIEQVVHFIRNDKAVNSLRNELLYCIDRNIEITEKWLIEYQNKVFKHELQTKSKMKKFKWFGVALSTLLPGGALLQEVALEVGQNILENQIESKIEDNIQGRFSWYYTLQKDLIN